MNTYRETYRLLSEVAEKMHVEISFGYKDSICGKQTDEKPAFQRRQGHYVLKVYGDPEKAKQAFEVMQIMLRQLKPDDVLSSAAEEVLNQDPDDARLQQIDAMDEDHHARTLFLILCGKQMAPAEEQLKAILEENSWYLMYKPGMLAVSAAAEDPMQYAQMLRDTMESEAMVPVWIGCSMPYGRMSELKTAAAQAETALRTGQCFHQEERAYVYGGNLIEQMVVSLSESTRQQLLCTVEGMDEMNDEDAHTVEALMNCSFNAAQTARQLYIHRNTLLYRIERISRITGLNIMHLEDAQKLQTAFLIRESLKNRTAQ